MYNFADFLVLWCMFSAGFFFGYYCKYTYIYDNLFPHWHALLGVLIVLGLAAAWTFQKHRRRQYCFNHFYIIFYGLICFVISACFMLADSMEVGFYFGFIGLGTIYVSSLSFMNLRCNSGGLRPMRLALGNTFFYAGATTGFILYNELEPQTSGWIYLGVTLVLLLGTIINETLQCTRVQCYKTSCDLVFNLMNDEKFIFLSSKAIFALFTDRSEFYFEKNRQWLVVGLTTFLVLERVFFFSLSYFQLAWSSTFGNLDTQYLFGPFLLYTLGCAIGTALLARYKPKLIYVVFGLIKVTATAAILGVYDEQRTEHCFYFLCFYYVTMGVYSSIAIQLIAECTPFLYTEAGLSLAFVTGIVSLEVFKYEVDVDDYWALLLGLGLASMCLTVLCLVIVQLFAPPSESLIEIRNRLLGIRRHSPVVPQTKIWQSNYFLQHDMEPNQFTNVCFEGNRVFQQYPRNCPNNAKQY